MWVFRVFVKGSPKDVRLGGAWNNEGAESV